MEQVKDYNIFFRQLQKFKKENGPVYTNFYLLGGKLKNIISLGKLYYEVSDSALIMCEDEGEYYQFYYCVREKADIPPVAANKTCTCWLIWGDKTSEEDVLAQRNKIIGVGFEPVVKSIQYTMKIGERADTIRANLASLAKKAERNGITLRYMEADDYEELSALWHQCFDSFRIADIGGEMESLVAEKRILLACRKEKSGREIIGSQFMDFQAGRTVHTHKTCVNAKCRGMGVGKLLVLASLNDALKRGCTRWLVEVDEGNTPSLQMHFGAMGERPERTGVLSETFARRLPEI